jgi:hypothetical protein
MTIPQFLGFSEPTDNYYRLPNDWFTVAGLLRDAFGERFASPLKHLEYVLKHTWGYGRFEGQIRLTAKEIASGRMKNGRKLDLGTGLSESSITKASKALADAGFLDVTYSEDKARSIRTFKPRMKPQENIPTDGGTNAHGFTRPTENYFKVPMDWTNMCRATGSAACILATEYFFRHGWGYHNSDGIWLDADDVAFGRRYKESDHRYDSGIGFELSTTYRALNEAVKLGFLVWAELWEDYQVRRIFNLRLDTMPVSTEGKFMGRLPWDIDQPAICTVEDGIRTDRVGIGADQASPICIDEEAIGTVGETICIDREGICTDAETFCIDAARTVAPYTFKDTSDQHFDSTPSTTPAALQKEKAPLGGDGVVRGKTNPSFPVEIQEKLATLEWADTSELLWQAWEHTPDFVTAWLDFALSVSSVSIRKSRAGLFRTGLLSNKLPPYSPQSKSVVLVSSPEQDTEKDASETLPWPEPEPTTRLAWEKAISQLKLDISIATFDQYVRDAVAVAFDETTGLFTIGAPNAYVRDWLDGRLTNTVRRLLTGILNRSVTVQFIYPEKEGAPCGF